MKYISKFEKSLRTYKNIEEYRLNMLNNFLSIDNLALSAKMVCRGKARHHIEPTIFTGNPVGFLYTLYRDVLSGSYIGPAYRKHKIKERKERVIYAPEFVDKIVHHMINNILREYFERFFYEHSYSCCRDKGTEKCSLTISKFQYRALKHYKDPQLLKLDLSKFFYTIDRNILIDRLLEIRVPILIIKLLSNMWSKYENEIGLPLGNLTSQLLANVYMDVFDKYVKHILKVKYYVRYADDMFFILDGIERAKEVRDLSIRYLEDELKLIVNPVKVYIVKAKRFEGIGCKYIKGMVYPLGRNKKKLREYFKNFDIDNIKGWISKHKHCKINNLILSLCKEFSIDPEYLKVKNTNLSIWKK